MINDYSESKYKCLILSFDDFEDMLNSLYSWVPDEVDDTSFEYLWEIYHGHFRFRSVNKKAFDAYGLTPVTLEDIAEVYMVSNIIDIISDYSNNWSNRSTAKVYIIYN